jgi:N-methylhydantoinase A
VTVLLPPHVATDEDRAELKRLFDTAHEQRFSHSAPEEDCEVGSLRVTVIGVVNKPPLVRADAGAAGRVEPRGTRRVYTEADGWQEWPSYARASLAPGATIEGPALVDEPGTTTVVEPGDRLTVDEYGNLHVQLAPASWSRA